MLALSCWPREVVVIGSTILYIGEIRESKVKIGIDAPKSDKILRMDLVEQTLFEKGYLFVGVHQQRDLMYKRLRDGKVMTIVEAIKESILINGGNPVVENN